MDSSEYSLYELRETEDRGFALFAARDISTGSRVIEEKPILVVPFGSGTESASPGAILTAFEDLVRDSPDLAQLYMKLHCRTIQEEDAELNHSDLPTLPDDEDVATSTVTEDASSDLQVNAVSTALDGLSIGQQKPDDIPVRGHARVDSVLISDEPAKSSPISAIIRHDSGIVEYISSAEHTDTLSPSFSDLHPILSLPSSSTLAPYDGHEPSVIINIFETNSLCIEIPTSPTNSDCDIEIDTRHAAICLTTARLNHSCTPNLVCGFNASSGHHTVHAIRDIAAGEELTISYIRGAEMTAEQRRQDLSKYHFTCVCTACSGDTSASDLRRSRLRLLRTKMNTARTAMTSGTLTPASASSTVDTVREMLALRQEEGIINLDSADMCGAAGLCCLRAGGMERVGEAVQWWGWKVEVLGCCLGGAGGEGGWVEGGELRELVRSIR